MARGFALIVVLAFITTSMVACEKVTFMPSSDKEQKEMEAQIPETESLTSVNVPTIAIHSGDKVTNVSVEMAVTDDERSKGLKGRESLPKNYGMWFVFPIEVSDPFWMQDTLISLDIIFVGSDMKIVDIIENTTPGSAERLFSDAPYRYALEVASGFAKDSDIKVGDLVEQRIGPR